MSVLTLLNSLPTAKRSEPKPERLQPKPKPTLPRYNTIAHWVKFVHPPIGDQAQPEGRGKVVPATCEYSSTEFPMDSIGCQVQLDAKYTFVEGSGWELSQPAPEPVVERPTKSQYIQAFQAETWFTGCRSRLIRKPLPECVQQTWNASNTFVFDCEDYASLPRRARQALACYWPSALSCAYDRGLLGRIKWYCESHQRRAYAAKYAIN